MLGFRFGDVLRHLLGTMGSLAIKAADGSGRVLGHGLGDAAGRVLQRFGYRVRQLKDIPSVAVANFAACPATSSAWLLNFEA